MVYIGKRQYRLGRMLMSHMVADTLNELHDMADKLGIARRYFQDKKGRPHYDICKSSKSKAITLGAKEVSEKWIIAILCKNVVKVTIVDVLEGIRAKEVNPLGNEPVCKPGSYKSKSYEALKKWKEAEEKLRIFTVLCRCGDPVGICRYFRVGPAVLEAQILDKTTVKILA
jgi:hypothetical protein